MSRFIRERVVPLTLCLAVTGVGAGFSVEADAFPLFGGGNGAPPPGPLPRNALNLNQLYDPIDARFEFNDVSIELGFDGSQSEGAENPSPFDVTSISIFGDVFGGEVDVQAGEFVPENSASWFLDIEFSGGIGFNTDDPDNPFWFVNSPNEPSNPGSGGGVIKLTSFDVDFDASEEDDETACTADTCQLAILLDPNTASDVFAFQFFPIVESVSVEDLVKDLVEYEFGDTGRAVGSLCNGGNYGVDPAQDFAEDREGFEEFCRIHSGGFNIGPTASVPEPAPLALLGVGFAGLLMRRAGASARLTHAGR